MELEKISAQYRKFTKGQYVAYDQFNEFLDHFEDQDRLSRILLRGVGVTCGLKPVILNRNSVRLSSGSGITTDGDLLNLENTTYSFYREYDNFKAEYPPFYKDNGKQIELVELIPDTKRNSSISDEIALSRLPDLEKRYVILYLESYEEDARPCKGVDCDSHGIEKVTNIRVLLTNKEGITHLVSTDSMYQKETPMNVYNALEEIVLDRPILTSTLDTTKEIKGLYTSIITSNTTLQAITNNFKRITNYFSKDNQLDNAPLSEIITNFLKISTASNYQYGYAFLQEVIGTYNEIKEQIPALKTVQFPDIRAFQKHIMLGQTTSDVNYRHHFYASSIIEEESVLAKINLLIQRFNLQVQRFALFKPSSKAIKITPSKERGPLGEKAIPFFYNADDQLRLSWNFYATRDRNTESILSYFPSSSTEVHIKDPLAYDLDQASFFRIEGHQGKSYTEALDIINVLRFQKQLAFDVVTVSLAELEENDDQTKAYYKDYLEKHAGLEHKSGVYTGGTFVLVYESEKNPTIVADFTLPYLCCSKKQDIGLTLPMQTVCEDAEPFMISSEPINARVKAFVGEVEINAIEKRGSQNYFNPSKVPAQYSNQAILFTVNGVPVDLELVVKPVPEVRITTSVQAPEAIGGKYIITYSGLVSDFDYVLDFQGDGNTEVMLPNKQGEFIKLFSTKSDGFNVVSKVYVTNSTTGCTSEYNIKVESLQDISIVSVNFPDGKDCCSGLEIDEVSYINGQVYCLEDAGSIPFIIKTVNDQPFDAARVRFKLSSEPTSNWKEHTIKDINNPELPRITSLGVYDVQVRIAYEGQETDWFTCPNFKIKRCDVSITSLNFLDDIDCCSGLEIDEVSYIKGQDVYCLEGITAIPFIIKTVNDQSFNMARVRFKLSSEPTSDWKEHTIKDINDPALPIITNIGIYDVQVRIAYKGQETDWFTCPNFKIISCVA